MIVDHYSVEHLKYLAAGGVFAATGILRAPTNRHPAGRAAPPEPVIAATPPVDTLALGDYVKRLSAVLALQQMYPRIAMERGWEGEVRLSARIARKFGSLSVQVLHGSGDEILDQQAIRQVRNSTLPPPAAFGDRELQLVISARFKLASPA